MISTVKIKASQYGGYLMFTVPGRLTLAGLLLTSGESALKRCVNQRKIGSCYENLAADFLTEHGLHIRERNYRCRIGEVDLIAMDGKYLVFVEVKYRKNGSYGNPLAAVNLKKQQTLGKVAEYYLLTHKCTVNTPCRFDVIGILDGKVQWVRDAFQL